MSTKYVYLFSEGNATMRNLLGGKGANLAEMTALGMPVPQGFTITTEACTRYYDDGKTIGADIQEQIDAALVKIEEINGKKFGDAKNPLLVSVRSGARASMPGMMDHHPQPRPQRRGGRGPDRRQPRSEVRALCLRLLPPFHPDVLRRGDGDPQEDL